MNSSSGSFLSISSTFRTNFFLITLISLCCCKVSLDTFKGRSSESTTPWTKLKYEGIMSLNSSVMNTLLTYNLMLSVLVPYRLKDSPGWEFGTKRSALKVTSPSATKWTLVNGSLESLVRDL